MSGKYKIYNAITIVSITLVVSILAGYFISGGFSNNSAQYMSVDEKSVTEKTEKLEISTNLDEPLVADCASFDDVVVNFYYTAKIIDEKIAIVLCDGEKEEFLYYLSTNINTIPKKDREALELGITLSTKTELAEFEEDYTS